MTSDDRAADAGRLRSLLHLLGPQHRLIGAAVASGIAHQAVVLGTATIAAWLVGLAVTGASPNQLTGGIAVLAALALPVALLPWLESFLAHVAAFRVLADIRGRVFAAFERLAPAFLVERRSGELGATAIADVELLERFFAHTLSPLIVASTVPVAALLGLGIIHWALALGLTPVLALLISVPRWLRRQAAAQGDALRSRLGSLNAEVVDLAQGLREVLIFGDQRQRMARLAREETALLAAKVAHSRRAGFEHAATDGLTTVGLLLVLVIGALLVSRGAVAPALLPVAVMLGATSLVPVAAVLDVVRDLNLASAAAARVSAILGAEAAVVDRAGARPAPPLLPTLAFDNARFRYRAGLDPAVDQVSFEVRPGETVALVGPSGAGKSTLSSLALRLWDVEEGAVRIGGHDVRTISQESLRDLITLIPQDTYLFNTSLRENIRLGAPDADDAAVEAAARAAMAHEFISALPAGYDALVGELGGRLSGGQRQRIAIARALLRDTPILVMDEAVANLDAASEQELAAAISEVRRGRASTWLIVAHRLSTIRSADRLVVLDRGRVVEQGTHEQLLAQSGFYAALISSQLSNMNTKTGTGTGDER